MTSNLFRLVRANAGQRSLAVLSALLYGFCPAAARWWRSGAEPVPVFDSCWSVIEQIDAGRTLKESLEQWGLDELTPFARRYVSRVEAYRGQEQHRRVHAPEAMPTFIADVIPLSYRHRLAKAFEQIGGWENFYPFLRAWAFVLPDWLRSMQLPSNTGIKIQQKEATFSMGEAVHIPLWRFYSGGRSAWGILSGAIGAPPNFLTAWIAWSIEEESAPIFRLGPEGRVLRYRSGWPREDVLRVLGRLADIAATGPYPPSGALEQPAQCLGCGYQALCWAAEVSLSGCPTPLALSF